MKRFLPLLWLPCVPALAAELATTPGDRALQNYVLGETAFLANPKWAVVGFGLVFGSMALSWITAIVLGGFKIGSLERRVEHRMSREEYAPFWERMRQRLLQIGFVPGKEEGVFGQSGTQFGDMSSLPTQRRRRNCAQQRSIMGRESPWSFPCVISTRLLATQAKLHIATACWLSCRARRMK